MGYVEETGVAQHYRDIRIAPIYEGTNGIQAMDLVGRKLGLRGGAAIAGYIDGIAATAAEAAAAGGELAVVGAALAAAVDTLRPTTQWLLAEGAADPNNALAGATPYLRDDGHRHRRLAADEGRPRRFGAAGRRGGGFDPELLDQKVVTARFYATQILPRAAGLAPAVTAGPADLFAASFSPVRAVRSGRQAGIAGQLERRRHLQAEGLAAGLDRGRHGSRRALEDRDGAAAAALDDRDDRPDGASRGGGQHLGLGPGVGDGELAQGRHHGRRIGHRERHAVEREVVAGDLGGAVDEAADVVGRGGDVERVRGHVGPVGLVEPQVETRRAQVLVAGAGVAHGADQRRRPLVDDGHRRRADGRRDWTPSARDARSGRTAELADPVTVTVLTHRCCSSAECRTAPGVGTLVSPGAVRSPGSLFRRSTCMRTYSPKASEITHEWHVVNADGLVLGRMATEVARVLRGKHKPIFAPHIDTGDHVIIINAKKVVLTSGKADRERVYRHSGYPGGIKSETYGELLARKPEDAIRRTDPRHAAEGPAGPPDARQAEGVRRTRPPALGAVARAARPVRGPSPLIPGGTRTPWPHR